MLSFLGRDNNWLFGVPLACSLYPNHYNEVSWYIMLVLQKYRSEITQHVVVFYAVCIWYSVPSLHLRHSKLHWWKWDDFMKSKQMSGITYKTTLICLPPTIVVNVKRDRCAKVYINWYKEFNVYPVPLSLLSLSHSLSLYSLSVHLSGCVCVSLPLFLYKMVWFLHCLHNNFFCIYLLLLNAVTRMSF